MLHLSNISHLPRLALPTLIYTPLGSLQRFTSLMVSALSLLAMLKSLRMTSTQCLILLAI